jgi:phage terminase large subunit-like protein
LGGNRSGKTRAGAQEVLWYATGTHPFRKVSPPVDLWAVSLDFPTSRDVAQPIIREVLGQRYMKRMYEADKILELTNGSTIGFKSVDAGWEKFQGTAKDLIWFDEEPTWDVYQECLMRVVDRHGSIIGTMTPLHGMTWVYDEIYSPWQERSSEDIECFIASIYDNPYVKETERKFIEDKYFDEEREARLSGRFVSFAGLIYKEFNRDIHIVKRFVIPASWTKFRGLDPGINNPTACIWLAISPENEHYIYDEYCETDANVEQNAGRIKQQTGLAEISATYIDPSACNRNPAHPQLKSLRDEYAKFDVYTVPGNNDVLFGINRVKEKLRINEKTKKPSLYIFDDCMMTLRELVRYRWDTYRHHPEEKNPKERPKKVMDHLMDALRYIEAADPIHLGGYADIDIKEETKSSRKYKKYG